MTRRLAFVRFACVVAAGALVFAGQTPQTPQAPQGVPPPAQFRSVVDHVSVDVVVTDEHDQPITDLTKDDFEITQQGKAQTIADFNAVFVPPANRAVDATVAVPETDVATNIASSPDSRALVMVIDDLHIIEPDLAFLKDIVTAFVKALSPDDQAGIVFVGRSDLSVNLTSDASRLMKVTDRLRAAMGFGEDALGVTQPGAPVVPSLLTSNARSADFTLKNIAKSLEGSAFSRRAIIFVSSGTIVPTMPGEELPPPLPQNIPDDHLQLNDIFDASKRADVPIYTIDPRGLAQPETAVRAGIGAMGGYGNVDASAQRAMIAESIRRMQRRLREHSGNTGGRSFENRNDYPAVMDELMTDTGTFYVLGFYPDPFVGDGKFHALDVKVKRPGARVRARAGYVASNAADTDPAADTANPVAAAVGSAVSVGGIALRAAAAPIGPGTAPNTVATAVTLEMTYPPITNEGRAVDDDVQMLVAAVSPDAKVVATSEHAIHFTGTASAQRGVTFYLNDLVDLPQQQISLRVGVSSRALARVGSVQLNVEVPKLGEDTLQLGGLLMTEVPATGEQGLRFDAIKALVPFQPTTSRSFEGTDAIRVVVPVFWGGKDQSADAKVAVADVSGMEPKTTAVVGTATADGRWRGLVDVTLPIADVPAGPHGLQIKVTTPSGQSVTRLVAFEVH